MARVSGFLADYGMGYLTGLHPTLHFQPSGASVGNTSVFAPDNVVVAPVSRNGYFEVDLQPTAALRPSPYYTVTVRWGSGRNAQLPGKLSVPATGGVLADLLNAPSNPGSVWIDEEPPTNPTPGTWWLNPITGDLKEWSA